MSNQVTFIITLLMEAWTSGEKTYGQSISRWILNVEWGAVQDTLGWSGEKVMAELVKKQPQLEGKTVLEVEETNIFIA